LIAPAGFGWWGHNGAGYFLAHYVTTALRQLDTYGQSEIYLLNEHLNDTRRNYGVVVKFIDDDLRAQYQTCINSGHTAQERAACLTPRQREDEYGIPPPKPTKK